MPKQDKELPKVSGSQLPIIWTKEKKCCRCKETKTANLFNKLVKSNDGLSCYCAECNRETNRISYQKNREKVLERQKKYKNKNKEQIKLKAKKYREKDPEAARAKAREWHENNRERTAEYGRKSRAKNKERIREYKADRYKKILKAQRQENREEIKEKKRRWYADKMKHDANFRLFHRYRKRILRAIKNQKTNKLNTTSDLIGCNVIFMRQHLEKQFKPGMTWENHGVHGWHIDHIKPCAAFDLTDPEQQKECFNYKNTQPLWAEDNLKKGSKYSGD